MPQAPAVADDTTGAPEHGPGGLPQCAPGEAAPAALRPGALPSTQYLERRKTEIVNEMLVKIKPFVGPGGAVLPDANFEALARLMEAETEFLGRTLILTILASSTQDPQKGGDEARAVVFLLCDRLSRCSALLAVLQLWLQDTIKAGEPICHLSSKILDILGRLHLTVEQLLQYKFGKLIKKLLVPTSTPETLAKAQALYDKWSALAKDEDVRRRSSPAVAPAPAKGPEAAVENPGLFSEAAAPKTRAELILERAAAARAAKPVAQRYSSAPPSPPNRCASSRPMSADDIHRAKKRRQYLQEAVASGQANPEELEQLGIDLSTLSPPSTAAAAEGGPDSHNKGVAEEGLAPDAAEEPVPRPRKRVSFASEADLVQIRYIEAYNLDDDAARNGSSDRTRKRHKSDYQHADKQEASYAFKRLRMEMEAEAEWREPRPITITDEAIQPARGEESTEREAQELRERRQVSAVYFSPEHVPASPLETEVTHGTRGEPGRECPRIPETAPGVQVQRIVVPDPRQRSAVDPAVLALLANPGMLQGLLPRPPMPPMPMGRPPMMPPLPPMPPGMPPMPPGMLPMPPMMPPMMPGMPPGFPPLQQMMPPRPPFPFPLPPGMPPPFPMNPMAGMGMMNNAGLVALQRPAKNPMLHDKATNPLLRTRPCKFYQAGQPSSCKFGSNCLFAHQD